MPSSEGQPGLDLGIGQPRVVHEITIGGEVIASDKPEDVDAFTGAIVYPIINRAEVMDLSVKTIDIDRRGKEGLICQDNIRADIKVTFFVRVNKTREDVLKVAQSIGCARKTSAFSPCSAT